MKEVRMNRREFLEELRKNLSKLPADEVDAAVEFYEEYFDEALDECETDEEREAREKELIEEAGRPAAIAARIRGEYAARILEDDEETSGGSGPKNRLSALWWIILGVCSAPVSLPVAAATIAVVVCLLAVVISLVICAYAALVGVGLTGLLALALAVVSMGSSAAAGAMFLGAALGGLAFTAAAGYGVIAGTRFLAKATGRFFAGLGNKRKNKVVK